MCQDLVKKMKKILPFLVIFVFIFATLFSPVVTFAQQLQNGSTDSRWVIDPEVTFIGKNARRSGDFLNWTLQNYNWVCVKQINANQCDNSNNPIATYWSLIVLYIVVPMLFLVILATSMVIIITRGKSLTIMRFIPRFVAVVLLIIFSYSLLQFFYQITDLIQGFFLRTNIANSCPPNCISDKDLLYVGWDYNNFVGLRLLGDKYAESAFTSLLLTKLTALTYFVMVFLLLVRKIILWFFIIVSPIFPILLLYYPVRNTGKIWIGEFFRWLLYAPLFAIFLNGLVYLWRHQIPLVFSNPNIGNPSAIEYPTAVNILLGGPKQIVSPTNSVNLVETFALYVVSLIMLWIVILLPWILLQIFLDYAQNFAPGDTAIMKTLVNMATSRNGTPPAPKPSGTGTAITLPFAKKFSVPVDIKPGPLGAAKEISMTGATLKTAFNQPAYVPNARVNAQVLTLARIKLPTIRDIARFDVALRSQDITKQQDVSRFSQQLLKVANPIIATNVIERNQFKETHEKILQQSHQGNLMATSLLQAANASSRSITTISTQKMKNILQQMANPTLATGATKETMIKLNSLLKEQSTQKNNQLAASILSVTSATSDQEIQKIKERLLQSSHNQLGRAITSSISQSEISSWGIRGIIKKIANPTTAATTADRERLTSLRGSLEKASKKGNHLAASILAINEKTAVSEIEDLQKRIQEAKEKGEPMAAEITALAKTEETKLPLVNRIQTVSREDYQAVRDMWRQNYQNLEIPQGMASSRIDWINDDIEGIDEAISLLSSQDPDKVQQGMNQVSNLLPFLLVGGFSQTEVIDYLKAKEAAAKDVSAALVAEEEEKVAITVNTHPLAEKRALSAVITDESAEDTSLEALSTTKQLITPQQGQSADMLKVANLKLPTMQDIAHYETQVLGKNQNQSEATIVLTVLEKIANPLAIPDIAEQEKYEKIRGNLIAEREKGNTTAAVILAAANKTKVLTPENTKHFLSQIANPSLATKEIEKKRFTQLHESLTRASQEGNELATEILSTKQTTSLADIQRLSTKLQEAKEKGETVAGLLPDITTPTIPTQNTLQQIAEADYTEVRKIWEENYRILPIPEEFGSDRVAWINTDSKYIEETLALFTSSERERQQEGINRVSSIMPILLLGGFSQQEIIGYLQAKLAAGKTVLIELQKEEENKVTIAAMDKKEELKTFLAEDISTNSGKAKPNEEKK